MSRPFYVPPTEREEIETLHRMFEAAMQYDERLRYPVVPAPVLRITEESMVPAWAEGLTPAVELKRLRMEHRRMQAEVCRGLKIAGSVLGLLTVWAATLHSPGLTMLLGLLAFTCLPLYLLASPATPEVR